MKKKNYILLTVLLVLYLCAFYLKWGSWGNYPKSRSISPRIHVQINPYLKGKDKKLATQAINKADGMIRNKRFSGTITVVRNGKLLTQVSAGWQNHKMHQYNSSHTQYLVASVSKSMTAALIGKLAQEGKIKLSDPLSKYYPTIKNAKKVTLQDLLNHRSGLVVDQKVENDKYTTYGEYLKKLVKHSHIDPKKIGKWKYQSYNYNLLAGIATQISHLDYRSDLNETVMCPLNITGWNLADKKSDKGAINYRYSKKKEKLVRAHPINLYENYGAGQLEINGWSLYRALSGLLEGRVLSRKVTQRLYALPKNTNGTYYTAGFYHLKNRIGKQKVYHIHGLDKGCETSLLISTDGKNAVIVQSNARHYTKAKLNYYFDKPIFKMIVR